MLSNVWKNEVERAYQLVESGTYIHILDHTVVVIIFIGVINFLARRLIIGLCLLLRKRKPNNAAHQKKIDTIQSLSQSTARYTITFLGFFKILVIWGVPAESLTLGSAMLVSAVGFGSQGLIQDMVTGISLLFEEQIRVGDYVEINGKLGTVHEVGLRVVKIQQADGTLHTIFNREVTMVSTMQRLPGADDEKKL